MVILRKTTTEQITEQVARLPGIDVESSKSGLVLMGSTNQILESIGKICEGTPGHAEADVYDGGKHREVVFGEAQGKLGDEPETVTAEASFGDCLPLLTEDDLDDGEVLEEPEKKKTDDKEAAQPADEPAACEAPVTESLPKVSEKTEPSAEAEKTEKSSEHKKEEKTDAAKNAAKAPEKKRLAFTGTEKKRELPPILPVPATAYTAEDAVAKLEKERGLLSEEDMDGKYVLEQIESACRTDRDLCQYIMREGKTFIDAYEYFANLARSQAIGIVVGNYGVHISREYSTPYFVEYFKIDDGEIARRKKEEEEKRKAERAAKDAARKNKKSGTKPASVAQKEPGLLEGMKLPEAPKAQTLPPAVPKAKAPEKEAPKQSEQLDLFSLFGAAV